MAEGTSGYNASLTRASTSPGESKVWATARSMPLAVAITTRCDGCIDAHVRKAKVAGATKAEIAEALGVAIALNAGAAFTYALHALDATEEAGA